MLTVTIDSALAEVVAFLSEPLNLRTWTVHRNLYQYSGGCFEYTGSKNNLQQTRVEVRAEYQDEQCHCAFLWTRETDPVKSFVLTVVSEGSATRVQFDTPPDYPQSRIAVLERLITLEFYLLSCHLEQRPAELDPSDAAFMQEYHLAL